MNIGITPQPNGYSTMQANQGRRKHRGCTKTRLALEVQRDKQEVRGVAPTKLSQQHLTWHHNTAGNIDLKLN